MLAFPQLSTSALAQFPNRRAQKFRTPQVETRGGSVYRTSDAGEQGRVWTLHLTGITGEERAEIDQLFAAAEGRLRTFLFLDPNDNLLTHSSEFESNAWVKDAGLVISSGQLDPDGGLRATRVTNPTNGARRVYQAIGIPSEYQYCLSAYCKGQTGEATRLLLGPPGHESFRELAGSGDWKRQEYASQSATAADLLLAGVEVPALSEITLYGMQLETSLTTSVYRETTQSSGAYERCRFGEDEIRWTTEGPNEHAVQLAIVTVR